MGDIPSRQKRGPSPDTQEGSNKRQKTTDVTPSLDERRSEARRYEKGLLYQKEQSAKDGLKNFPSNTLNILHKQLMNNHSKNGQNPLLHAGTRACDVLLKHISPEYQECYDTTDKHNILKSAAIILITVENANLPSGQLQRFQDTMQKCIPSMTLDELRKHFPRELLTHLPRKLQDRLSQAVDEHLQASEQSPHVSPEQSQPRPLHQETDLHQLRIDHVNSPQASSSPRDKGKERDANVERVEQLEQRPDVLQHPELTIRLHQPLIGSEAVFPWIHLDDITSPQEKETYQKVLHYYAQALHNKTVEAFRNDPACQNILRNYTDSPIYYKWYISNREIPTCLIAYDFKDTRTNKDVIIIAPNQASLRKTQNANPHLHQHSNQPISMQKILQHLQNNGSTLWGTPHKVLRALYKRDEVYDSITGPIGLYISDRMQSLIRDLGGTYGPTGLLYNASRPNLISSGPWALPTGAIKVDSSSKPPSQPLWIAFPFTDQTSPEDPGSS